MSSGALSGRVRLGGDIPDVGEEAPGVAEHVPGDQLLNEELE